MKTYRNLCLHVSTVSLSVCQVSSLFYSAHVSDPDSASRGWEAQLLWWSLQCAFVLTSVGTLIHKKILTSTRMLKINHLCNVQKLMAIFWLSHLKPKWTINTTLVKEKEPSSSSSNLRGPQTNKLCLVCRKKKPLALLDLNTLYLPTGFNEPLSPACEVELLPIWSLRSSTT